jgi:hypothetical protein
VRVKRLVVVGLICVAACTKEQPKETGVDAGAGASASASAGASASASAGASAGAGAGSENDASVEASTATATPDAGNGACPAGMLLVDGDYCTEVRHTCKKEWYAKWNDKHVCEEFEPPKDGESACVGKKVHKRFCVDKYEYPNKEGVRCTVMNDFYMAQRLCQEQGKRMCTETEWTMACEGPSYKPFPYGYKRDVSICNGDKSGVEPLDDGKDEAGNRYMKFASKDKEVRAKELERLWQGVPSGSQPQCKSDYGVYDMPGNCDELASSEDPIAKFDNVTTGGPWRYGVRNQCRPKIYTHNEGFAYYYLSFRCCSETDGKPSDPRAPRQIQRKEPWRGGKLPVRDSWDGDPMPDPAPKAQ